jgi:hypothetical protein
MSVPVSVENYLTEEIDEDVYEDPWRIPFLTIPLDEIPQRLIELTNLPKCTSVYYPGSAGDIANVFMHTDCTTLIGCDMMDPFFYPLASVSSKPLVILQASVAVKGFELLREIEPSCNFEVLDLVTTEDSYMLKFLYRDRERTVTEYFRDANSYIPPPVDMVFTSGFSLRPDILERIKATYVVSEDEGDPFYYYYIYTNNISVLSLETGKSALTTDESIAVRAAFLRIFIGRKELYSTIK